MSDFYQKNYKAYHEKTFSIDPSSFLEPLARRLPTEAFILDVGCGSGRDLLWMKKQGFDVIGFERSLELAELARENAGCE
jgi:SAM-dependent methyltransferase